MNGFFLMFIDWIYRMWEWYIAVLGPLFMLFRGM